MATSERMAMSRGEGWDIRTELLIALLLVARPERIIRHIRHSGLFWSERRTREPRAGFASFTDLHLRPL
jgi:hypothetical protein